MPEPKWGVVPLKGKYCRSCVDSLVDFRLQRYSIVPMCREDLGQFLTNGDMEIVRNLIKKSEERMLQPIDGKHNVDEGGNPAGGTTTGKGIQIEWQNGPLGRGDDRLAPNGAFVEGVIAAAIDRINFYQAGKFKCRENAIALTHLETALLWLQKRTMEREAREVEGTHVA